MIHEKLSGLHHAIGTTTSTERDVYNARQRGRPGNMLMAAAIAAHALQNRSQADHTQVVFERADETGSV